MLKRSRTTRLLDTLHIKKLPKGDWDHSLPVEILEEIFALAMEDYNRVRTRIAYRRSSLQPLLRNLACVCQVWYSMITPILYNEIYISSPNALASLARAVTKHPHLQPLVNSFHYSSTIFKSASIEDSPADSWNTKRIYRACPNLNALVLSRPLSGFPDTDDGAMKTFGLTIAIIEKLTRLEIDLPDGIPCDGKLIFSVDLTFPALQELALNIQPFELEPERKYAYSPPQHLMEWPNMPKLVRLRITNWHVKHSCFCFPPSSKNLRIIELLGGNYSSIRHFFEKQLEAFTFDLESLTITAMDVACEDRLMGTHRCLFLNTFYSMSELCIPFRTFGELSYFAFPDNLQALVIAASPDEEFNIGDLGVFHKFEENLLKYLEQKRAGQILKHLKVVRVAMRSLWMFWLEATFRSERISKTAEAAGIHLRKT
ncbi:uncharacterized protein FOMMEDRAFT_148797 [Fomitiporia mediterranea MF3/22]|uniref:uncharacterized protein n=1 Tax=Fomitiporia mediterranea (strain MF3/22) TaxID=694068 RepID=UPI0004409709|nr:uncharacterized protein FOMMEDRAFT_148797 [Fomitiporia mediterranea MF3/22]EJC99285.1 hypothetical protein FOMMEDRAFT_148797 [Fomitiporia mediterranea MF3/22]